MSIKSRLLSQSLQALRDGDNLTRTITLIVVGDIEMAENNPKNKTGKISEDDCLKIVAKMVKSNNEMIGYKAKNSDQLQKEIDILSEYLPKNITLEEIALIFANDGDKMEGMKFGQIVGHCMKTIKSKGLSVDAKDVQAYVKGL